MLTISLYVLFVSQQCSKSLCVIFLMCFYFSFNIYYWTKITSPRFINSNICLYWLTNINFIVSFTNYKQRTCLIIKIFNNRTSKMPGIILNSHNRLCFFFYFSVGGLLFYSRYLCWLFAHSKSNTYCVVFLFCLSSSCVLCPQCCQFLWIVHFWLPLRYSLAFIYFG